MNTISKPQNKTNDKKDNLLQTLVNLGTVLLFFTIVVIIYKLFIKVDYKNLREGFEVNKDKFENTVSETKTNTIYESSLKNIYGDNKRLLCSLLPSINEKSNICKVDNEPYIIYKFPVHIIKLIDGSILSVFNDGNIYQKDTIKSTLWKGPIKNSMPLGTIPLRMVTLSTDLKTLFGIGYDNTLYVKEPTKDINPTINISGEWKKVPNNTDIIYILFDNKTNYLISIDIDGKLFTKTSHDITGDNQELITLIDRPILRAYYDLNGYMLIIDNKFDLYKFSDINWKTSQLQTKRGANPNKLQDILYDNDGKLYGLVFNQNSFMLQIMKQSAVYYLSDFKPLDMILSSKNESNFIMSEQDILKAKLGSLYDYKKYNIDEDETDNDPNFAYQKQLLESKRDLRQFCANRGSNTQNVNYENYELLADVENNNNKIGKLKNVIKNLMKYEPDKKQIQEKYAILNK